jgi:hypothetical protein
LLFADSRRRSVFGFSSEKRQTTAEIIQEDFCNVTESESVSAGGIFAIEESSSANSGVSVVALKGCEILPSIIIFK